MAQNEAVQWTLVALIVLGALSWMAFRLVRLAKNRGKDSGCGCCSQSADCKAKELKDEIRRRQEGNCHDEQSARN